MKTGLVIEGGGSRGIYAAGVLDALMEGNVFFDGVAGVSAGAIHGSNFVARQPGRTLRYMAKYTKDPRYMSLRSFLKTGCLFNTDFCYREIPNVIDPFDYDTFERSKTAFYAVSTSLKTGKAQFFHIHSLRRNSGMDLLRSSASMPLAATPVAWDNDLFLDGGVADSIPVEAMLNTGYDKCVVILTQPAGFRKKASAVIPLIRFFYRKYPKFIHAMETRHIRYNQTLGRIAELEKEGRLLVFRPSRIVPVSRTESDPVKLHALHQVGLEDGWARMKQVIDAYSRTQN